MIGKINLIILFILFQFSSNTLQSQTTIKEITDQFFQTYETAPIKAVDYVFGTNKWMLESNKDGIKNVKKQLKSFIDLVGTYQGYEKITEKSLGESYKQISYLVKYERQPIKFTFVFYNPKDKWQVHNFNFSDQFEDELK